MTSLLEKFRNARFPNWMRQVKADSMKVGVQAANDNIANPAAMSEDEKIILSEEIYRVFIESFLYGGATLNFKHPQKYAGLMENTAKDMIPTDLINSFKFKLKMPVSVKRRLRRDKKNYQKVRKWLDEVEMSVNQALFGDNADER